MVRTVFWYLIGALVIILIIAWLIGGGIAKIEAASKDFSLNSLFGFAGGGAVQLPWAVPIPQGPDISPLVNGASKQYAALTSPSASTAGEAQTLGNQSPYENAITLSPDGATASEAQAEYVVIQNNGTSPVDISGWSLQSALTGARAYIPLGASFFVLGELNQQNQIDLAPGGSAVVTTGESPVGTSFRENECSGYLEQLQSYTPPIQTQCPSPGDQATQAAKYGQSCADYVSSLPFCTFPQSTPSSVSTQCQAYVQTTFSYNGCVQAYQNDPAFASNDWRIYMNTPHELWNNDHDTIRLLDSQGETVAVTSY